jgi:hypothetical protein
MREYLATRIGQKLGVVRSGLPKEVYFEAELVAVMDTVAVFRTGEGKELAVALAAIVMAGPPDAPGEDKRQKPGFL